MSEHDPQGGGPADAATPASPAETEETFTKVKRSRDPEHWVHRPMHKYRKGRHALEFRPDQPFFDVADVVQASGKTLLGYDRLYTFWQAIRNLHSVPGGAAEVGSYRGGSAWFIASALRAQLGEDLPFHVFDTFAGHPAAAISGQDTFHEPGNFSGTSFDAVREYLSPFPQIVFHRGDVLDSLPQLPEAVYRLVHLDTDLYLPTKACLEYFEPRLSRGGVIVLDDYLEGADVFQAWDMRTEQLMLVKR